MRGQLLIDYVAVALFQILYFILYTNCSDIMYFHDDTGTGTHINKITYTSAGFEISNFVIIIMRCAHVIIIIRMKKLRLRK